MRWSRFGRLALPALLTLVGMAPARAAEVTRVVSGFDDGHHVDINGSISWLHEAKSAYIKRESESGAASQIQLIKDLKYIQTRDVLNLRVDLGVFWDVGLHIEAPLVLHDARSLDFDQSAGGCTFPGNPSGAVPNCVNAQNSTLLRDGILSGAGKTSYGLDAPHNRPFQDPAKTVFRGPNRSGLESLGLGLTWAAMNQARDDTKPTWTLTFDAKFDVGGDMRFDPANPGANSGVGLGYHQLIWSTFISKRFRAFDPYFGFWYMLPARTSGGPFQQYPGANSSALAPQQRAGMQIGFEQIAWEAPQAFQRVTIEFRGHAEEHFFGRAQSELWEPLSGPSTCATDAKQCRPGLDQDLDGDGKPDPYPGVTETQAYATFGGDVGLNVQVGRHIRFRGLFGLTVDQPHYITYADPKEAKPIYRDEIDLPGRRFKVEGTEIWSLFIDGAVLF
ncbi:MAG: hypothetical protein QOI66_950 [Myxococcales bacterium]|nr:hypothetical protein [Myxococcales bacterium]